MNHKGYPWMAVTIIVIFFSVLISLVTWFFLGFFSGAILPNLTAYSSILSVIFILSFIFWLWMLVDSLKREYNIDNDKFVWVLVIVFTWLIGAFLYYFMIKTVSSQTNKKKKF